MKNAFSFIIWLLTYKKCALKRGKNNAGYRKTRRDLIKFVFEPFMLIII